MTKLELILGKVLNEMIDDQPNCCAAIYWDELCKDNAIVMFMEYEPYGNIHNVMKELHKRLSDIMGYPVTVCHGSPTDDRILIQGGPIDARRYFSDECCKRDTLRVCLEYLAGNTDIENTYYIAIAKAADAYADMCGRTPEYVLNCLDYNRDLQTQLIGLMVDAYKFTKE